MSNSARQRLLDNESLFVALLGIGSAAVVDILGFAGVDCVELDSEHSALGDATMEWLLVACQAAGITPFWRSRFDEARVTVALDLGFTNFMFPHTRSAADVERALTGCRYRPRGQRGVGPGRPIRYGLSDPVRYIKRDDGDLLIGFMIEDPEAVENIEEIVAVPGIQLVQVGFWDLSVGYGLPIQERHPKLIAAAERVLEAALRRGVAVGIPPVSPEDLRHWHAKGARFFEIASDTGLLARAAQTCIQAYTSGVRDVRRPAVAGEDDH